MGLILLPTLTPVENAWGRPSRPQVISPPPPLPLMKDGGPNHSLTNPVRHLQLSDVTRRTCKRYSKNVHQHCHEGPPKSSTRCESSVGALHLYLDLVFLVNYQCRSPHVHKGSTTQELVVG